MIPWNMLQTERYALLLLMLGATIHVQGVWPESGAVLPLLLELRFCFPTVHSTISRGRFPVHPADLAESSISLFLAPHAASLCL